MKPSPLAIAGLIVDLFAGGGGASTAILQATGRHPDIAINHNPVAVRVHELNHPGTRHYRCDVREVDPVIATEGKPVDLLWASPDCTHFSKARGGKPVEKRIRSLADVVVVWARMTRPTMIALENVEEFKDWGPISDANGQPCPDQKGLDFRRWCRQLRELGYRVEWRELVAADYGAPTTRKRLFLIARCDGLPIVWPAATHAPRDKAGILQLQPWRAAAEIIDWGIPCPTIFDRPKPLAPKTQARIAKGVKRYVVEAARPFIVPVTHSTGGNLPTDAGDPLRTATASKGGDFALAAPVLVPRYGERQGQEPRVLDAAAPYPTAVPTGNGGDVAAAHLSPFISTYYGEGQGSTDRGSDVAEPIRTIPTENRHAVVAASFMQMMAQNGVGSSLERPVHTVMAGAPKHHQVAAYLGRQFGSTVSGRDVAEPHPTTMTDGAGGKSQVVAAHLSRQFGKSVGSDADQPVGVVTPGGGGKTQVVAASLVGVAHSDKRERAGLRAWSVEDSVRTVTAQNDKALMAVSLDSYYRTGTPSSPDEPLRTVTDRMRHGQTAAFMEQANTGMVGHPATAPVSTIVGRGTTQRLVEMGLLPLESPSTSGRAKVLDFLWQHFGAPTDADWAEPLASAQARLRFGLVLIDGAVWMIVDIGMRMLTPRELFNAQGFPPDYVIQAMIEEAVPLYEKDGSVRIRRPGPVTKTEQTAMAGNSVSPWPAAALLRVNCGWMAGVDEVAA